MTTTRQYRSGSAAWRGLLVATLLALPGQAGSAQDLNILLPAGEIEDRLRNRPFEILSWRGSRREEDRTQRVTLAFEDSVVLIAKWANAPAGGGMFNNEPRYEVAAFEVQKLFLDESEYVVPPTVLRAFPIEYVRRQMPEANPTFGTAPGSILVALQYWLTGVTQEGFWDKQRARTDTAYARHIGNFNILTYIIRQSDANQGNFLISTSSENPRVFSVDNGVSFASEESNRGAHWRELLVERLPRRTVERLKTITLEQLEQALTVLGEFEIRDGIMVPVAAGVNLGDHRGVRRGEGRIQLGLTQREIRDTEQRIRRLVRMADDKLF